MFARQRRGPFAFQTAHTPLSSALKRVPCGTMRSFFLAKRACRKTRGQSLRNAAGRKARRTEQGMTKTESGKGRTSQGQTARIRLMPHTKKGDQITDPLNMLAERKGLEPSASGVTGRRYNRLNYRSVVGSTGLEPVTPAV